MNIAPEQENKPEFIRAFIAVEIDEAARTKLAAMQEALKEANGHVSWVRPQNIHCTLVFLGDIFQSAIEAVAGALAGAAAGSKPFEIEIAGLGFFGSARSPRIIWSGIAGAVMPLVKLQNDLVTAVSTAGMKPDAKPFKPHLTIGRVRSNRNAAALVRALEEDKNKSFGKIFVRQVVLMQSRLTAKGPEYTLLQSATLGG